MKLNTNEYLSFWAIVISLPRIVAIGKTFKVSIQYDGNWSSNKWVEYKGNIPHLKEFTVCHWERLRYFSPSETTVWTYCSIFPQYGAQLRCIGVYSGGIRSTTNRQINISAWLEGWTTSAIIVSAKAKTYRHRSWNHICWTYSSIKLINKLYCNGLMIGNFSINLGSQPNSKTPIIDGGEDTFRSAFIIGQDQDILKGGYDPAESFYGEIAGLNMWDKDIGDSKIGLIARCKSIELGNVVSWERELWHNSKAPVLEIKDPALLCQNQEQLVVFPQPKPYLLQTIYAKYTGARLQFPNLKKKTER